MSTGTQIALGVGIALVVFVAVRALRRRPAPTPPLVGRPIDGVSEQTLAEARALVASGKVILAVKAVREETGWDLRRSKDVVDRLRAEVPKKREDGFGYYG